MSNSDGLRHPPCDKPLRLRNVTCIYCREAFGPGVRRTKEHVIGRDFVPEVSFADQWNLIANACERCNNEKSDLEGELAAITMQPDVFGRFAHEDDRLPREAERKATGAVSSRTGKPVAESEETFTVKGELMPGVFLSFGFRAPPQSNWSRAVKLAEFHLRAFFYLMSYNRNTRMGGGPSECCYAPLSIAFRQDWGSTVMRAFQQEVAGWPCTAHAIGADGYFKLAIRRQEPVALWAWALEWNRNLRLIGFLGEESAVRSVVAKLPPLRAEKGYRQEEPLPDDEDHLFDGPNEKEEGHHDRG